MLFFLIKKTFFDMWDNLLTIMLINTCVIFLSAGMFALPFAVKFSHVLFILYQIITIPLFSFLLAVVFAMTKDYAAYKKNDFREIFSHLERYFLPALITTVYVLSIMMVLTFVLPAYFSRGSLTGTALGTMLFWVWLPVFLSGFYFFPVVFQLQKSSAESIKICIFLLFDNFFFTIYMILMAVIILIISMPFFFLLPGFATASLWLNVCLRTLKYKYDYLESHSGSNRAKIPWSDLIADDAQTIGPRSFKTLFFPWKQ